MKMTPGIMVLWLLAVPAFASSPQPAAYVIGVQDVLAVTVFDQPTLTGKYTVEADGTVNLPWIGHIKADGLSVRDFEGQVKGRLEKGFLRNPQVAVGVDVYRSQRVFVMGNVRASGAYPLTGDMDLIEALSKAGIVSASEIIIVRPAKASGPVLPGQDADAKVMKIDVRSLQEGSRSQNVALMNGDTIFVPLPEMVYVFGQVTRPGAYPVDKTTTVLQALSLAGGVTELASLNKVRVIRTVDGKPKETNAKLSDIVKPGDTIWVRERWF